MGFVVVPGYTEQLKGSICRNSGRKPLIEKLCDININADDDRQQQIKVLISPEYKAIGRKQQACR